MSSLSSIDIGRNAVRVASHERYIGKDYQIDPHISSPGGTSSDPLWPALWISSSFSPPIPSGGGGGGGSDCGAEGAAVAVVAAVILSGVILTTCSSICADDSRQKANFYQKKQMQAQELSQSSTGSEKRIAERAKKMYGIMATERRVTSFAQGLLATGFAILTAVAIAGVAHHYHPNLFNPEYLKYGALAGAGFIAVGTGTYIANWIHSKNTAFILDDHARAIREDIVNVNSNIHERPEGVTQ